MALTRMNYFNLAGLLQLYRELGSATAIVENQEHLKEMIPEVSPRLLSGLKDLGDAMKRAETEWEYDQRYGIQVITMNDSRPCALVNISTIILVSPYLMEWRTIA